MELSEVKRVMALGTVVTWQGMTYTVSGCTLKYDRKDGAWYYLLELLDNRTHHSVMVVPMQDVRVVSD